MPPSGGPSPSDSAGSGRMIGASSTGSTSMRRLKILARKGLDAVLGLQGRARLRRWVRERDATRRQEASPPRTGRYLYASPVGASGQVQLEKMLARLPAEHFDFLI